MNATLPLKNLNPYMGVEFDQSITFMVNGKPRCFRVFAYRAYNAYGLIGPEHNGIAIADDDKKNILCDGLKPISTGYFGLSQEQLKEADRITKLTWEQFRDFVNSQPSKRMLLED